MKIYHTETQEEYNALMVELEEQGCTWFSGRKPTKSKAGWAEHKENTCIRVSQGRLTREGIEFFENNLPRIPITKYKAKADEKMKFTKENIYRLFGDYRRNKNGIHRLDDLESDVMDLDDTPEKVVVPKCFDEWYKEIEAEYQNPDSAKTFALWKLCQQGFGCGFEDIRGKKIPYETDLGEWLFENKMLAIDAVLNGYTTESNTVTEQRYTVVIADRYLVQLFIGRTDFRFVEFDELCAWKPNAFQLTEAEIKAIDERFWAFAVPAQEGLL